MKNKLLILILILLSCGVYAQNEVYDNLDVKEKLWIGGDIIYKGEILDSNMFDFTAILLDTTSYISIDDTLSLTKLGVTTPLNAYTSNNQYAIFTANDTANIDYKFPTFNPVGDVTGVQISLEYKMIHNTGSYYAYFRYIDYATSFNTLPIKLTSDTTVIFGGINNLLGLNALLDSVVSNNYMLETATIRDMIEDTNFTVRILAIDSTLSVDHIKMRAYYSIPVVLKTKYEYPFRFTDIILDTISYSPIPLIGKLYAGKDGHLYFYDGTNWKQCDN